MSRINIPSEYIEPEVCGYAYDPYIPVLEQKDKELIYKRCEEDYWYFFSRVLRVTSTTGLMLPFRFNYSNTAFLYCKYELESSVLIRSQRQTLKSTSLMASLVYDLLFKDFKNKVVLFKNLNTANTFYNRLTASLTFLPRYISYGPKESILDKELFQFENLSIRKGDKEIKFITSDGCSQDYLKNQDEIIVEDIDTLINREEISSIIEKDIFLKGGDTRYTISSVPIDKSNEKKIELYNLLDHTFPWNDAFYNYDQNLVKDMRDMRLQNAIIYIEHPFYKNGITVEQALDMKKKLSNDNMFKTEILLEEN